MSHEASQLYWINQFAATPAQSGGTRHYDMSRELVRRGWDVEIVASDWRIAQRAYLSRGKGQFRPTREDVSGVGFTWLFAWAYVQNDIRRVLNFLTFGLGTFVYLATRRGLGNAVVIGSTPQPLAAVAAMFAARLRGAKFVLEVRDLWPEALEGMGTSRAVRVVVGRVSKWLYSKSDAVIVVAEGMAQVVREAAGSDATIVFVPNGVDPREADSQSWDEQGLSSIPKLPADGRCVFVYAGALGPANGLDVVVEAAALLVSRGVRFHVLLIGDGAVRDQLRSSIAQYGVGHHVSIHPSLPKSSVQALLRRCDVGLLILRDIPAFRYGVSPNKLFDYLLAGLPVLSTVPGEVEVFLDRGPCGITCTPEDAESLAAAMTTLAEDGDYRRRLGVAGPDLVRRERDRRRLTGRLESVLRGLS